MHIDLWGLVRHKLIFAKLSRGQEGEHAHPEDAFSAARLRFETDAGFEVRLAVGLGARKAFTMSATAVGLCKLSENRRAVAGVPAVPTGRVVWPVNTPEIPPEEPPEIPPERQTETSNERPNDKRPENPPEVLPKFVHSIFA